MVTDLIHLCKDFYQKIDGQSSCRGPDQEDEYDGSNELVIMNEDLFQHTKNQNPLGFNLHESSEWFKNEKKEEMS